MWGCLIWYGFNFCWWIFVKYIWFCCWWVRVMVLWVFLKMWIFWSLLRFFFSNGYCLMIWNVKSSVVWSWNNCWWILNVIWCSVYWLMCYCVFWLVKVLWCKSCVSRLFLLLIFSFWLWCKVKLVWGKS